MQPMHRGTEFGIEGRAGRVGHRPALLVDGPPGGLIGAGQDVLHGLDLGPLGQRSDLSFECGQLIAQPTVGVCERLARQSHRALQCLGPIKHPRQIADDFSNQRLAGRAGTIHDAAP